MAFDTCFFLIFSIIEGYPGVGNTHDHTLRMKTSGFHGQCEPQVKLESNHFEIFVFQTFLAFQVQVASGNLTWLLNMVIIVDLPIKDGDFP